MTGRVEHPILYRFFQHCLGQTFSDLNLVDEPVKNYLVALLVRFIRTERLYRIRQLPSFELESVLEFENSMTENENFSRKDELIIRQHIADFTLFMTGIFREFVQSRGFLKYYYLEGGRSYLRIYNYVCAEMGTDAAVFENLGKKFEVYSGSLDYLKKVYFYYPEIDDQIRSVLSRLLNW